MYIYKANYAINNLKQLKIYFKKILTSNTVVYYRLYASSSHCLQIIAASWEKEFLMTSILSSNNTFIFFLSLNYNFFLKNCILHRNSCKCQDACVRRIGPETVYGFGFCLSECRDVFLLQQSLFGKLRRFSRWFWFRLFWIIIIKNEIIKLF